MAELTHASYLDLVGTAVDGRYYFADSEAREDIRYMDHKMTIVLLVSRFGVENGHNIFYINDQNVTELKGSFSPFVDGACLRCVFGWYDPTIDLSLPFYFKGRNKATPPVLVNYPVYSNYDKSVEMGGKYPLGAVLDFVYSENDSCFFLVGPVPTAAAAVPYDNSNSGLTATDVQAAIDELAGQIQSLLQNI